MLNKLRKYRFYIQRNNTHLEKNKYNPLYFPQVFSKALPKPKVQVLAKYL